MEHNNEINPETLFFYLLTLMFAGCGHLLSVVKDSIGVNIVLHYLFAGAQGLCYIASACVGAISVYKFFKSKKKS